jgi:hypothetical protein
LASPPHVMPCTPTRCALYLLPVITICGTPSSRQQVQVPTTHHYCSLPTTTAHYYPLPTTHHQLPTTPLLYHHLPVSSLKRALHFTLYSRPIQLPSRPSSVTLQLSPELPLFLSPSLLTLSKPRISSFIIHDPSRPLLNSVTILLPPGRSRRHPLTTVQPHTALATSQSYETMCTTSTAL